MGDIVRQREEGDLVQENPGADRYLGAGQGSLREVNNTRYGSNKLTRGTPCGCLAKERRQAVEAGGWGRRTGGWLLRAQASWGGRSGCKER